MSVLAIRRMVCMLRGCVARHARALRVVATAETVLADGAVFGARAAQVGARDVETDVIDTAGRRGRCRRVCRRLSWRRCRRSRRHCGRSERWSKGWGSRRHCRGAHCDTHAIAAKCVESGVARLRAALLRTVAPARDVMRIYARRVTRHASALALMVAPEAVLPCRAVVCARLARARRWHVIAHIWQATRCRLWGWCWRGRGGGLCCRHRRW